MISIRTWLVVGALGLGGLLVAAGCVGDEAAGTASTDFADRRPFNPRTYAVHRTGSPPTIDGRLADDAWQQAAWTAPFVNSRGRDAPAPPFRTRAKMMWDDRFFYIAAELEEPDVRASFTTRDTSVWRENAFELFIDPTGDTHNYHEYQINARETQWDLLLTKPYRDGGVPISAWDIRGLKKGVAVQGTLNDPSDEDDGWTVELALPWSVLAEAAPEAQPPQEGDRWRMNLTRMQWPFTVSDGTYVRDTTSNDAAAWSPQVDGGFHMPERWGIVEFVDTPVGVDADSVQVARNERVKWALRRLYYRQRSYRGEHGTYASSLEALDVAEVSLPEGAFEPSMAVTQSMYEITAPGENGTVVHIRHDGFVWITEEDD